MVFLFFLAFIIILFVFSTVKIEIKKLLISNIDKIKIDYEYLIFIKLYVLRYIKIFQFKIDNNKIKKSKIMKDLKISNMKKNGIDIRFDLNKLRPDIQCFDLNLKVGTENILLTNFIILISSIGVSFLMRNGIKKYKSEFHKFRIEPVYNINNLIDLKLNCIIKLKMVHIINIICIVMKKRSGLKNARTSNRRINANSHEQYTRYDRRQHNYR